RGNGGVGGRSAGAFGEPHGGEVAILVECLGGCVFSLASENRVVLGREQIANLFRHRAVGGIERRQRIGRRRLLARDGGIGRRRGGRGVFGRGRSLARCSGRRTRRRGSFARRPRGCARRRCSFACRGRSRRACVLRRGGGARQRRQDQSQSRARQNAL